MKKEVVIIGGGFAGINLAKRLSKRADFQITVVDKNNYHFFPPLLYQVATGFLEASSISYPFRKMFQRKPSLHFRYGELLKIIPDQQTVQLSTGVLHYDYLVLATGTETNYFGMDNIRQYALPMKTVNDALVLRNFLLQKMEEAAIATNAAERKKRSTIVIAGGGPTGVEIAGLLAEMYKNIVAKDYPEIKGQQGAIYLVDAAPTLLSPMAEPSRHYTYDALTRLGVQIKLNLQVRDYTGDRVEFANGETIETNILIWAAGVVGKPIEGLPPGAYGRGKRLLVDEHNQVQGTKDIFAIGDTCLQTTDPQFPNGHPQLAQVAIQQGKWLAANLRALANNRPLRPFHYQDRGSMAIIGRNKAVADLPQPPLHLHGFIAWFIWVFIHLVSLISHRNRIITLYNWMIAYFSKDQSLRLIVRPGQPAR